MSNIMALVFGEFWVRPYPIVDSTFYAWVVRRKVTFGGIHVETVSISIF